MSTIELQGKTFLIVHDMPGDLVEGCQKCAFYDNDERCSDADRIPGHVNCVRGNHHYEEVTNG